MDFLSELCKRLTPYTAGEQLNDKKYIKLNTNENPYPPANEVDKILSDFDCERLRLYPDFNCTELSELIAKDNGLKKENIFVGNGSDEVLAMIFPAFFGKGKEGVIFADITYSFYKVYCKLFNVDFREVPLKDNFDMDINDYMNFSEKGAIIANPNAPTGLNSGISNIEKIVKNNPDKLFVIDEAYTAFAKTTALPLVKKYNNILVVQTFSKSYSLAGIRCGFAVGNENLIEALNRIKNSFNSYTVNALTQKIACAAYCAKDYYRKVTDYVIEVRELSKRELVKLGFYVTDSETNFIFASHKNKKASDLYKKLKDKGILVRYFNLPRIDNFIRITVGTKEQMQKFIEELKNIL